MKSKGAAKTRAAAEEVAAGRRKLKSQKALAAPLSRVLIEIAGKRKLSAEGLAEALTRSAPTKLIELRRVLDQVLADDRADELDESVWGKAPTEPEVERAEAVAGEARAEALAAALDGALTREQVAGHLGISPQAVSKRTQGKQLVALRRAGQWRYPHWQFTDDDVVPQLAQMIESFPSMLTLTTWATQAAADLDGATPAEMVRRRGGVSRVLGLIEAGSATAW